MSGQGGGDKEPMQSWGKSHLHAGTGHTLSTHKSQEGTEEQTIIDNKQYKITLGG